MTCLEISNNTKLGLPSGFLKGVLYTLVGVWQSVGRSGNAEIELVSIKKNLKNLIEIIMYVCSFLTYWSGMYNKVMQEKIFKGVQNAEVNGMRPQGVGESTGLFVRGERLLPSPSDDEQDDNGDNSKGGS